MGAYYAMLARKQREPLSYEAYLNGESPRSSPEYRIDQPLLTSMFAPANQIDRRIRPDYWASPDPDIGGEYATE
jgi:hypothetical protein